MRSIKVALLALVVSAFSLQMVSANEGKIERRRDRKGGSAVAAPAQHGKSFARPYGMAGCGLGSQLMGREGNQIFAATSNSTFWNQTFAITAGTSNCVDHPEDAMARKMDRFILVNKSSLAGDVVRGGGETTRALSNLMGCADTDRLNAALQSHFSDIYPSADVAANVVTDSIITVVQSDAALNASCNLVAIQ